MATEVRVRDIGLPVSARCEMEGGTPYVLVAGTTFPADHPLVSEQEWAFETIETATAAPGEKRAVKRPRKPAADG